MRSTQRDERPDFEPPSARLPVRRAGIDTYRQPVLYLHRDCLVSRAEGFAALTRVSVQCGEREVVALLNIVTGDWLGKDEAALSDAAWQMLAPEPGAIATLAHAEPPGSASVLRAKVFGKRLNEAQFEAVLRDTLTARLSDIELAAFVTVCAGDRLDLDESVALTRAMVSVGERIDWGVGPVLDKHCVGGLPGNRTTPIVVSIVAALGHRIPKTSSRAITSPAGTADVMATMTVVDLDIAALRDVVNREGGCMASGGKMRLSPADDVLIQIERPLDLDGDGQMVASILSKKAAAGSTHVLIDIPVGDTAKVRTMAAADAIARRLAFVGEALGLRIGVHICDGRQPVGRGIGPALEAHDVLEVLRNSPQAPSDLRERALDVAGAVLELLPGIAPGSGRNQAAGALASGSALRKFLAICSAQGGFREPERARFVEPYIARSDGVLACINNRQLARIAKLAGAPRTPTAGVVCTLRQGDTIRRGMPLFLVHAGSRGELAYALDYAAAHPDTLSVRSPPS
ncbi:thymidine phosphorylase family protein [Lysobacter sp. 22409]|uniref:thymidine phosphorylase family protein n=1 Tax=Lysobacter sp. 22409 TaxID=3453917 RepID=UPI003F8550E6